MSYIYLIQLREFVNNKTDVYKMGKSKQKNCKRVDQYPKGSKVFQVKICNDCDKMEKKLLEIFRNKFIQRKDIGSEYFEGDCRDMMREINEIIEKFDEYYNDDNCDLQGVTKTIKQDDFYNEFAKLYIIKKENKKFYIKWTDLKNCFHKWCNSNHHATADIKEIKQHFEKNIFKREEKQYMIDSEKNFKIRGWVGYQCIYDFESDE